MVRQIAKFGRAALRICQCQGPGSNRHRHYRPTIANPLSLPFHHPEPAFNKGLTGSPTVSSTLTQELHQQCTTTLVVSHTRLHNASGSIETCARLYRTSQTESGWGPFRVQRMELPVGDVLCLGARLSRGIFGKPGVSDMHWRAFLFPGCPCLA
jgi:hypothetical protein